MSVWIGVDGGGTSSRAWATDADGQRIARASAGPGLIDPGNPGAAAAEVEALARKAMTAFAKGSCSAAGLWAGLAGAGNRRARARVQSALLESGIARKVRVGSDQDAAYHDAFGSGSGMLLIAGTGSAATAGIRGGRRFRIGGWGRLLGDEGSGYAIGLAAMRSVVRAEDGRGFETALKEALLEHARIQSLGELPAWAENASKKEVAAFAADVFRIARDGDAQAHCIVGNAVFELSRLMEAAADLLRKRRGKTKPIAAAAVGGLIQPGGPLRDRIEEAALGLGLRLLEEEVIPERGAAGLARAELGG